MTESTQDIDTLAKGGRTNIAGFVLRLAARIPFLFIAGRIYGPDLVGRFAIAVVVVELAALLATLGLKRGLAQALNVPSDKLLAYLGRHDGAAAVHSTESVIATDDRLSETQKQSLLDLYRAFVAANDAVSSTK